MDALFTFAAGAEVEFDDKVSQMYKTKLQPQILHELGSVQGLPWLSFTLVKIAANQYVFQISSDAPEDGRWQHLKCALQAKVLELPQLDLEVQIAEVSHAIEIARLVPPAMEQPYDKQSKNLFGLYSIGRSIGVDQAVGAGTLGGFITINHKGEPRTYGLTNNHVANRRSTSGKGVWAAQRSKRAAEQHKRDEERKTSRALKRAEQNREKREQDGRSERPDVSRIGVKQRRRVEGAERLKQRVARQEEDYESKS